LSGSPPHLGRNLGQNSRGHIDLALDQSQLFLNSTPRFAEQHFQVDCTILDDAQRLVQIMEQIA